MKKIFVTGANGYIGCHLVSTLLSQGYELTAMTRKPWLKSGVNNKVSCNYDTYVLESMLVGQDIVIHLAGIAHQPQKNMLNGRNDLEKVNVDNVKSLAEAAKNAGVKRFIFLSSIKALGEATVDIPFNERSAACPQDAYGRSKLAAEKGLHEILDGSGTELVIIRPPLVWGGAVKGNLASLQKLISLGVPLPLGSLVNRRDLVSINNLCSLICCVIHHPAASGQSFLVSDGIARSTAEIAYLVAPSGMAPKLFNCSPRLFNLLAKAPILGGKLMKLVSSLEVDITHTKQLLGWSPESP